VFRGHGPRPVAGERRHLLVRFTGDLRGAAVDRRRHGPAVLGRIRHAVEEGDVQEAERLSSRLQHGHAQSYQRLVGV